MISILCKNNAETIAQVEKYFEEHNLEKDEATRLKQRNLRLKDILCLDYDDVPDIRKKLMQVNLMIRLPEEKYGKIMNCCMMEKRLGTSLLIQ